MKKLTQTTPFLIVGIGLFAVGAYKFTTLVIEPHLRRWF